MKETGKFGFWSIVLLGMNGIVGTGIFLLPNKAYSIIGSASLGVLLFDAVIEAVSPSALLKQLAYLHVMVVLIYMQSTH